MTDTLLRAAMRELVAKSRGPDFNPAAYNHAAVTGKGSGPGRTDVVVEGVGEVGKRCWLLAAGKDAAW